jgi:hypothetical protein
MMMEGMNHVRTMIALLGMVAVPLTAGEVKFASPVSVTRVGLSHQIGFAASERTDCAVAIADAEGKIVRHLAAGVLGSNAPAPLHKDTLQQTLTWDGRDDRGGAAEGGPFRVRVSLGLKPMLEEMLGDNPAALGSVRALAVGPKGEVFVFHVSGELHPSDGTPTCTVFDRDGIYSRTILPFPGGLPEDRWTGLRRLTREDGTKVPFLYQAETRSLLPGAGDLPPERAVATRDGRVAFAGILEGPHRYATAGQNRVMAIRQDGGVPAGGLFGPELAPLSLSGASLALAPDEKTFYAAGLSEGKYGGPATAAVLSFGWEDKAPRVFAGSRTEPGSGLDRLNTPRSVAVDGAGNVYVADRGNDRVAVFKPDGAFLGALPVAKPERVEVHPVSGAVYVLSGERMDLLQKFAGWDQPKPIAETKLPFYKHPNYTALLALDASVAPAVLWVASPMGYYAKFDLLRIEDQASGFATAVDIGRKNAQRSASAGAVLELDLDPRGERLLVNTQSYDLRARKWGRGMQEASGKSITGGVGAWGRDGNFYTQIYPNIVRRFGPDLQRRPFPACATDKGDLLNPIKGTMRVRGRGITADVQGNVYVLWEDGQDANRGEAFNHLYVYGADGSLKVEKLIATGLRTLDSVRVDAAGNVYLALGLRPGAERLPAGLQGQVPDGREDKDAVGGLNAYPLIYGSLAKFGPEGGLIRKDAGGVACNYAFGAPIEVKGAHWIFSGVSPVVSWRTPGTPDICNCESARFDVDGFGRSFFPDAARCRVGILDTGGNLIGWFGTYGNAGDAGTAGQSAVSAIPLMWPYCIAAGDEAVFVGDRVNHRVARVKLASSAEQTRALP